MKRHYQTPEMVLTRVELESPICGGSVQIGGDTDHKVDINDQSFETSTNNDFSNSTWEIQQ